MALRTHSSTYMVQVQKDKEPPDLQIVHAPCLSMSVKREIDTFGNCKFGEAAAEWSACGCGEPADLGSSPTDACWQFSTITKWQKITHVLSRS